MVAAQRPIKNENIYKPSEAAELTIQKRKRQKAIQHPRRRSSTLNRYKRKAIGDSFVKGTHSAIFFDSNIKARDALNKPCTSECPHKTYSMLLAHL